MTYLKQSEKDGLKLNLDEMLDNDILSVIDMTKILDIFAKACERKRQEVMPLDDSLYEIWCPVSASRPITSILVNHSTGWSVSPQTHDSRLICINRTPSVRHDIGEILSEINSTCLASGYSVHFMVNASEEKTGIIFVFPNEA